ncbi:MULTISPECIES: MarR family winged helix-turn-helix transcriptional regulator [Paenibacillus]|jgi:DNA-binding MarR family transcriptional regulator|uniref:MarR family winged helix-turn-helix transcriptional regulator n=1 Tax=Paenibacillus illinoisensis TaxID=59845 RepID=A0ABW8HZW4_9BACL|nr:MULTISPECIES: MarR family transcriptional regulator [Paenibacillus]MBM6383716.1 MarR family transcriptional regulator [Paenibacillus sp.]PAD30545.1 MarR family transcriptional regulator [Paenibacillus sp. 7523-1]WJH27125.1 MarR family transcriptional regulator [Paenibacillus sp. CC-CFT742]
MEEKTIFEIIHNMDTFTNKLIIQWNKSFNEDLGVSHVLVLSHLKQNGKSRPSDIAKVLGLTPPTLSYLSDKLVGKKLAVRVVDESDRRNSYLDITEDGSEVLGRASMEGQKLRRALFEKLTAQDREKLAEIFEKLNR